ANGGAGGIVIIQTVGTDSDISISGNINAYGGSASSASNANGGAGGIITIQTVGTDADINVSGDINANGGAAYLASSVSGGAGGIITIQTAGTDADISAGNINAYGGTASSAGWGANGGAGGIITIGTSNIAAGADADINISGTITVSGGSASALLVNGGSAGTVSIITAGGNSDVLISNTISAVGGNASTPWNGVGTGGNGGVVTIGTSGSGTNGADILINALIDVDGGNAHGVGGKAGDVYVTTLSGSITAAQIDANGGFGFDWGPPGDGGTITISAGEAGGTAESILLNSSLNANGGNGSSWGGGGNGGTITITGTGTPITALASINANGGTPGFAFDAGDGGTINITTSGSAAFIDLVSVSAYGATAGSAGGVGGDGGDIAIATTGTGSYITISGNVNAYGGNDEGWWSGGVSATGGAGGTVDISTIGSSAYINVGGTINTYGGSALWANNTATGGAGGNVTIDTADDNAYITANAINAYGGYATCPINNCATGGAAGDVTIGTTGAGINGADITINALIDVDGGYAVHGDGGLGGAVSITTLSGSITAAPISSNGGDGGNFGPAGNAGSIIIAAGEAGGSAESILLNGSISANGGSSNASSANAGNGGTISITGSGTPITALATISANGGNGSWWVGNGGNAGTVDITTTGTSAYISLATVNAIGGNGATAYGNGGDGGDITISTAGADAYISIGGNIDTYGGVGHGSTASGGNGGAVDISTVGDSAYISVAGSINAYGGSANTGWLAYGGLGGNVDITTQADDAYIITGDINAYGGYGYAPWTGNGGTITISTAGLDSDISTGDVNSYGGNGSWVAGSGNSINITTTSGNITVGNVIADGGSAFIGGDAGTILIAAAGTDKNVLMNGDVSAMGGAGVLPGTDNTVDITSTDGWIHQTDGAGTVSGSVITLTAEKGIESTTGDYLDINSTTGLYAYNDIDSTSAGTTNILINQVTGDLNLYLVQNGSPDSLIDLRASTGSIVDADLGTVPGDYDIIGHDLSLTAAGSIGAASPGEIDIAISGVLNVTAGGNAYIGVGGDVTIGDLTVTDLVLSATGSILDDGDDATMISASTINLTAGADIGSAANLCAIDPGFLDIDASALAGPNSIALTGSIGGDIYLNFLNADFLSSFIASVDPNVSLANTLNSMTIGVSGGNALTVDTAISDIYFDLNLLSTGALNINSTISTYADLNLAAGGDITVNNGDLTFNTAGSNLVLQADFDGDGTGAIILGNSGARAALANVDEMVLIAGSGITAYTSGVYSVAANNSTTGDILIDNTGNLTVFDGTACLGGCAAVNVNGIVNDAAAGNIDVSVTTGNLIIDAMVFGAGGDGNITLSADAVAQNGYVVNVGTGTIDVTANAGDITMAPNAVTGYLLFLNNGSFETGDTTGWTLGNPSFAVVVTGHTESDGPARVYNPVDGTYFLRLNAGAGANVYTTASQNFILASGATIAGYAAYDAHDYAPYTDDSFVRIYDSTGTIVLATPFIATVNGTNPVGNYGSTPWTLWNWTAPSGGTYQLRFGVRNTGDNSMSPQAIFDAVTGQNYSGDITYTATGNVALATMQTTGNVTVNAGGAITDVNAGSTNITANTATLSAVLGIGSVNALETSISNLQASNTGATGNIEISNTGNLTVTGTGINNSAAGGIVALTNAGNIDILSNITSNNGAITINATGAGYVNDASGVAILSNGSDIAITAGGNIGVSDVNAGAGNVTLTSGGAIYDTDAADNLDVTGFNLVMSAVNGIGSGNTMETSVNTLQATNTLTGGIQIYNNQALTITGTGVVNNGSSGGNPILIMAEQDINVNAPITNNAANGNIELTSLNDDIWVNAAITNNATGGSIALTADDDIGMTANITSMNGSINLTAETDITQATATTIDSNGGTITIIADSNSGGAGDFRQDGTAAIFSDGGDITIQSGVIGGGDPIYLGLVNAGTGNVNVRTFDGQILDNNGAAMNIVGNVMTLTATSGIGTALECIETTVNTINATTTTGGIYLCQTGACLLENVVAGAGDVNITNTGGDMLVNYVEATTGAVNLDAQGGSILDSSDGAGMDVVAGADSTLMASGVIGTYNDPLEVDITGSLGVSADGARNAVSVNIDGIVDPSDTLDILNSPPGLVIFNGHIIGGGNLSEIYRATVSDMNDENFEFSVYSDWLIDTINDDDIKQLEDDDVKSKMQKLWWRAKR
ncbi:MAG: hypothetical protein Q8K68_03825, partial [Nitrospirota bacterium]|nr:hypothetical protein [Nitrospirota bacterium]